MALKPKTFSKLLSVLINLGTESQSFSAKIIKATNAYAMVLSLCALIVCLTLWEMKVPLATVALVVSLMFWWPLVLNKWKRPRVARLLLILNLNVGIYIFSTAMGRDSSTHVWFITSAIVALSLFKQSELYYLCQAVALPILSLLFLNLTGFQYSVMPTVALDPMTNSVISTVMLFLSVVVALSLVYAITRQLHSQAAQLTDHLNVSIRSNEEKFKSIIENLSDHSLIMLDRNGLVATWSQSAQTIKGYAANEAIGHHYSMFFPIEDIAAGLPDAILKTAMDQGRHAGEGWRVAKSGKRFFASYAVTAVLDDKKQVQGFTEIVRDYTINHRSVESLALTQKIDQCLVVKTNQRELVQAILHIVTEQLKWKVGIFWKLNIATSRLEYADHFAVGDSDAGEFANESKAFSFSMGQGLPGRVWKNHKSNWLGNATDDKNFLRSFLSQKTGINQLFAIPIEFGDQFLGCMEFATSENPNSDPKIIEVFNEIRWRIAQRLQFFKIKQDSDQDHSFLKAIMTSANYTVIATDLFGIIQAFNPAAEKILGYTANEVIGKMTPAGFHKTDEVVAHSAKVSEELGVIVEPGFDTFVAKARLKGVPDENEWTYIRKDGSTFPARLSITALLNSSGELAGYVGIGFDLSVEHQIRKDLVLARQEALAADKYKSEFLANMSHEIRTPMNGVIGLTDLLLKTDLNEKQKGFASTIKSSGQLLMAIINDILDFSKMEAGKLEVEMVNISLRSLIETQAQMLMVKAEEKNLSVLTYIDPRIPNNLRGDSGRIGQILTNLIGNAIKFTSQGQVVVRVVPLIRDDFSVSVRFSVEDTGIGLTSDQQAKLFRPFQQGDGSTSRKYGGTGLGLSICKKLTELMKGTIGVESVIDRGSTFWFNLPFEIVQSNEFGQPWTNISFKNLRFLIVESDLVKRTIVQNYTFSWGMINGAVSNHSEALNFLGRQVNLGQPYDFVFIGNSDCANESSSLVKEIFNSPEHKRTKIIWVGSEPEDLELRTNDQISFFREPFRQSELFNCISSLLGHTKIAKVDSSRLKQEMRKELILLVEDNSVNQMVALNQLESLGFTCHTAANGREAVNALSLTTYDLILMDCQMPEMDGFEATRRIRKLKNDQANIPIIALTANAMTGDKEICLAAGMNDYLTKPIDIESLKDSLGKYLPLKNSIPFV